MAIINSSKKELKQSLEKLYKRFNNIVFFESDPIFFPHQYRKETDIEVVAFISACFAFGRVSQINKTLKLIFEKMGKSPTEFLLTTGPSELSSIFEGFKYRFVDKPKLCGFLLGIKKTLQKYGSLKSCFLRGYPQVWSGLYSLYESIGGSYLLPNPRGNSACKRLNLFLRWMVRNDNIDFGIWTEVETKNLIVPLDTHIYKIGIELGFTTRKSADRKTALQITEGFKNIFPNDPLKYDFALCRSGILLNNKFVK